MVLKTIESPGTTTFDWVKWLMATLLLVAGIVANYYYSYQPWPLRLLGWIFLLGVVTAVVLQTYQGKQLLNFARESRMELRKVVWPTYQETVQTTLFVAAMVNAWLILWVLMVSQCSKWRIY